MNFYNEMSFILWDDESKKILFTGNIIDIIKEANKTFKEISLEEMLNIKLIHDVDTEDIVLILKSIFVESELRLSNLTLKEIQNIINDFFKVSDINFKIFILNEENFISLYRKIISDRKLDIDDKDINIDVWLYENGFTDIYSYTDWFIKYFMKLDVSNFEKYDKSYLIYNIKLIQSCKKELQLLLKNNYELNNIITLQEAAEIMDVYPSSIKYLIDKKILNSRKSSGSVLVIREELYFYMKNKVYKKYLKVIEKSKILLEKQGFTIDDIKYFWNKDKYIIVFEKTDIPGNINQEIVELFNDLSKNLKELFDKKIIHGENEIYKMGE